nr:YggS family pyridoxal phosphate-dependent enzyme [Propionibacterium sp.]
MTIAENLAAVEARIAAACARAGRPRADVRLLPVSKTHPAPVLREAYAAGVRWFGENKAQEAAAKAAELADLPDLRWSFIGHLQTNKARDVAGFATEFQALDSLRIAEALDRRLQALGRGLDVLIEVDTSGEESKFGVPPEEVPALARSLAAYPALRLRGLMTVAANTTDAAVVAACFERLAALRARLQDSLGVGLDELSMGMSGDFELAIEHGATCIRVGTAVFGAREYPPG